MAIVRFYEYNSDVYIYFTGESGDLNKNKLECCACSLIKEYCYVTEGVGEDAAKEMIEHVKKHVENGDEVPEFVIERLNNFIEWPEIRAEVWW